MNRHTDLAAEANGIAFREFETCSCGVRLAPLTGQIHEYMLSTPSCWRAFGALLAREYEDPARWSVHRHSVDAYAVQHPGIDSPQARNSVGIHLSRLYFSFSRGWPTDHVDRIMPQIVKKKMEYPLLKPPSVVARVNIGHVLQSETAADHRALVLVWAESCWAQWWSITPKCRNGGETSLNLMTFILNSTSNSQPETSTPPGAAQNEPSKDAFLIRPFEALDTQAVWEILKPIVRDGETYALPRNLSRRASLGYWLSKSHQVYVAESGSGVVGTYFLRMNQRGGGSHVANCGYATAPSFSGQGVATSMCVDSLERARHLGFAAMQFNFVVSTNSRAIALWARNGFAVVGCIPHAFLHPVVGLTDVYVMYREL